ncbi:zinc finger protein 3-like [Cheilinus undulatus]|uniref:zinc finger protein 3-like n=1 Tax=Cheilinus undulatus TaxID=241271 RepID=UPI001BD30010|nr:zinc finger protein 3-like [Cheilinus undulatus]
MSGSKNSSSAVFRDLRGRTTTRSESGEEPQHHRKPLDVVSTPEINLQGAGAHEVLVSQEEPSPEQQEWSPSWDQEDTGPPQIKEEQEELWSSQEGEQLGGIEEADTKLPFTIVVVKNEDDEETTQSSQLYGRHTEQMETGADGEDCGGAEAARNSDSETHLQPETVVKTEDFSEAETEDSDGWREATENQSEIDSVENSQNKRQNTDEKSHSCPECGITLKNKQNLGRHMRIHTGEKPFSCSACGKRFNQKTHLARHLGSHLSKKPYSCSGCDQRFSWPKQFKKHKCVGGPGSELRQDQNEEKRDAETGAAGEDGGGAEPARNSDPEKKKDSNDWRRITEQQLNLISAKKHNYVRQKTGKISLTCPECGKTPKTRRDLRQHMLVHTGERPFSCSECGKRFNHKSYLTLHMAHHRGEKPYSCSGCDRRFAWFNQLKRHKCLGPQPPELHQSQTEKREAETGADGEDCGRAELARNSDQERNLKPETEDISKPEMEDIDHWMKTTDTQSGLISVVNTKNKRRKRPHCCFECGKTFESNKDLTRHIRIHTEEKPFSCFACRRTFSQKEHLSRHMLVHTGEKPFSCSECGKRFSQKSNLTLHMAHHRGDEPFSCSVCSKRFNQKDHLTRHMLVHTGEKPFVCSECNQRFKSKYNLTRHMIQHKGEKPFGCPGCDRRFFLKFQLKNHKCPKGQASGVYQKKTEGQNEAEPEADEEDFGGAEPARNLDPERHFQPEIEIKTEVYSEPESEDHEDWFDIREHQIG